MNNKHILLPGIVLLFLSILGASSCKGQIQEGIDLDRLERATRYTSWSPISPYYPDSLQMVFYKRTQANDTSWALAVYKVDSYVCIRVNEITPKIIAENYSFQRDTLGMIDLDFINFNGYTSKLPLAYWKRIIDSSNVENYEIKDSIPTSKLHGIRYTLFYKSKVIVHSDQDARYLESIDKLLSYFIIDKIHYRASHMPNSYVDPRQKK